MEILTLAIDVFFQQIESTKNNISIYSENIYFRLIVVSPKILRRAFRRDSLIQTAILLSILEAGCD